MPFPPHAATSASNTHSDPFDLSSTLYRITVLQAQLTTNMQSARLLGAQIKREKQALKRDQAELAGLETALKTSRSADRRKTWERGLHPVAQDTYDSEAESEIERVEKTNALAGISKTAVGDEFSSRPNYPPSLDADLDPDLASLLSQLRNHLASMRANTSSLQPVAAAIEETNTSIAEFAAARLDERALKRVYGVE